MQDFELKIYPNDVELFHIPVFDETGLVKTAFSTRKGGVSCGHYTSLNLGEKTEDQRHLVNENYRRLKQALKLEDAHLVSLHQIHSDQIIEVNKSHLLEKGSTYIGQGDALITSQRNIALVTYHADCIPVYFLDVENKAIGMVHSGWKGTVQEIAVKTFKKMQELYNSKLSHTMVAVGPGIDFCCFEIGKDVYDIFKKEYNEIENYIDKLLNGKYLLNLKGIIKEQLERNGFRHVILSNACTKCEKELFFSHRRDKGITGRMVAIIQLL